MATMKLKTERGSKFSGFGSYFPSYIILMSNTSLTKLSSKFSCAIMSFIVPKVLLSCFSNKSWSRNMIEVERGVRNSWEMVDV